MIEPPDKLSQDILNQIAVEYAVSVNKITAKDIDYVIHRFETMMMKLRAADDWRQQVYTVSVMLLSMYNQVDEGGEHIPDLARDYIGAALYYVCKPFDVISDNIPVLGFVDDAHVLNLCLESLEDLCPQELRQALKEHGL